MIQYGGASQHVIPSWTTWDGEKSTNFRPVYCTKIYAVLCTHNSLLNWNCSSSSHFLEYSVPVIPPFYTLLNKFQWLTFFWTLLSIPVNFLDSAKCSEFFRNHTFWTLLNFWKGKGMLNKFTTNTKPTSLQAYGNK